MKFVERTSMVCLKALIVTSVYITLLRLNVYTKEKRLKMLRIKIIGERIARRLKSTKHFVLIADTEHNTVNAAKKTICSPSNVKVDSLMHRTVRIATHRYRSSFPLSFAD